MLVPPVNVREADWKGRKLEVRLTKDQIKDSPPLESDLPVSRQQEIALADYFDWPRYWGSGGVYTPAYSTEVSPSGGQMEEAQETPPEERVKMGQQQQGDPHLRSAREVAGYRIAAQDGEVGHVHEMIVDDQVWSVRYLVVDTRHWLPGRQVLVAPPWADTVDWSEQKVQLPMTRAEIKDSPPFDPNEPVNREYEERLYDYYGRKRN